jgi:hypothetical protein
MKIYRASFYEPYDGNCLSWFTTRKEAETYLKSLDDDSGIYAKEIRVCEFKPTRQGIVEWLSSNSFAETDNG